MLLPTGEGGPTHDCKEVLQEVYASLPELRDRPISNRDWTLYTDGTSLMKLGQRLSGYAVVTEGCHRGRLLTTALGSPTSRVMGLSPGIAVVKR